MSKWEGRHILTIDACMLVITLGMCIAPHVPLDWAAARFMGLSLAIWAAYDHLKEVRGTNHG